MGEESICSSESSKVCGRCGITKPLDQFYKIVAKDEKSVRTDKVCKSCKGEIKKARKVRTAIEKSTEKNRVDIRTASKEMISTRDIQICESPNSTKFDEEPKEAGKKKYSHPNYEEWEVQQAIEVFQILKRKRDEARRKGLINW
ncbi:MAG: hypothetical protein AB7G93_11385 [Bdellovibrionales bacterium]